MEEAGLVTRLDVGDTKSYYELSELVTDDHHHHLVCKDCNSVVDVNLSDRAERSIEKSLDSAATEAGFELVDHRIDLIGTCADCKTA